MRIKTDMAIIINYVLLVRFLYWIDKNIAAHIDYHHSYPFVDIDDKTKLASELVN